MENENRPLTTTRRLSWMAARWGGRALRVALAWAVVLACLALVVTRVSVAAAADVGMSFSDELMKVGSHHVAGDMADDVYTMELNGQTVYSSNSATHRTMDVVLSYYEEQCTQHAQGLLENFGHLDDALTSFPTSTGTPGVLVVRKDSEDRGYVFCVAPDRPLSTEEFLKRLARFGKTTDLSTVGDIRYVAVRKGDDGATQVVAAWTQNPFVLSRMFPAEGEVAGVDFGGVPRPDGARRVLSGTIQGSSYGVNSYEVRGSVDSVLASVDSKLAAAGWQRQAAGPIPSTGRFYALGTKVDVAISVLDVGGGLTQATYAVSRNVGHL